MQEPSSNPDLSSIQDKTPTSGKTRKGRKRPTESYNARADREFEPEGSDGKRRCKHCPNSYDGKVTSNLKKHLERKHPEVHVQYIVPEQVHGKLSEERLRLLQNVTEIVSVNGRSFNNLLDSGFQKIIGKKLQKFEAAGMPLNLENPHLIEVKTYLHKTSNGIREKISKEVRGRGLSLIVDIGTRNNRSIFGAAIQYIHNGKLRVRTICMKELTRSHTSSYLTENVIENLKLYDISLKQIMTITTDNGSNVLKMVRDVETILRNTTNNEQTPLLGNENNPGDCDTVNDNTIEDLLSSLGEISDEDAAQILSENVARQSNDSLLDDMRAELQNTVDILLDITGLNCAAHTLQLAVKDALKMLGRRFSNIIQLCRHVSKQLRLKSMKNQYEDEKKSQYPIPTLDVETRWGSTAIMIKSIIKCKNAIDFFADVKKVKMFQCLKAKWNCLTEIGDILNIPLQATIKLQAQNLNLSDVYIIWITMELSLKKFRRPNLCTELEKHLLTSLETRKNSIFSNPLMACAIFLDPRLHNTLKSDSVRYEGAKSTLKSLWERLQIITTEAKSKEDKNATNTNSSNNNFIEINIDEELHALLTGQGSNTNSSSQATHATHACITELLDLFQPAYINFKSDIFEYWGNNKEENDELYQLAMFVFSVPPTEVIIERNFSSLNFVFSDRRCKLQSERLEDIMIINLNKDLFDEVTEEDLKSLMPAKKRLNFPSVA